MIISLIFVTNIAVKCQQNNVIFHFNDKIDHAHGQINQMKNLKIKGTKIKITSKFKRFTQGIISIDSML